jgi:pimeloyl-ACP methyl ester carboxylesterase
MNAEDEGRVDVGGLALRWRAWGSGDTVVLFLHGNLACADWFELIGRRLPSRFRVVGIDWRGCGLSDKPPPRADYANYALTRHADDMLAALSALGIGRCHLATHSTGGLIACHMLLADPERFGRVLALAPAGLAGLHFPPESVELLATMKTSRARTRKGLALTATSLFRPESLAAGGEAEFALHATAEQRQLFEHLVDRTVEVSDGIWFGTPKHLDEAWRTGGVRARAAEISHPHRVLWGALDPFIPRADMEEMATRLPDCRLVVVPGVGHSLLLERPDTYLAHLAEFL